ncbi:MAG: FGGY-family carbohydrate kinase [Planctomycetia bacterium]|nr:FGGY-family carbohydrate kinase [Planctomycetia bacterium]
MARILGPARRDGKGPGSEFVDKQALLVGLDLGTSGVRALAVAADGRVVARGGVALATSGPPEPEGAAAAGRHEQSPEAWWGAVCQAIAAVVAAVTGAGYALTDLRAVCIDGTSGTLVPVDATGQPTRPAIMYSDARSAAEAAELNEAAADYCERLGHRFDASYALPKILWLARREPAAWERTAYCWHQTDYIASRLTGVVPATDYSNALKTGYDLLDECWPAWLDRWPGVADRLPNVVPSATPIGRISATAAAATGLPVGTTVVAGATDGVAASIASGLARPGDYNTTLGTTLVFKGISRELARHPQGTIYSHRLPGGMWLPGAASNTGGAWIDAWFAGADSRALDRAAQQHLPGHVVAYPLVGRGERFPFVAPQATGFVVPEPAETVERYAACLVGTALVERLAYEVLDTACGSGGGAVYATGGATASDVWMQCRADVTGRVVHRAAAPESAFGSAVLAAAGTVYKGLPEAIHAMVRIERSFEPSVGQAAGCDELFAAFRSELDKRGYVVDVSGRGVRKI